MGETVKPLRCGVYGERDADGALEIAPPEPAELVDKSIARAAQGITRDDDPDASIANLEDAPRLTKMLARRVRWRSGEDDETGILDADA